MLIAAKIWISVFLATLAITNVLWTVIIRRDVITYLTFRNVLVSIISQLYAIGNWLITPFAYWAIQGILIALTVVCGIYAQIYWVTWLAIGGSYIIYYFLFVDDILIPAWETGKALKEEYKWYKLFKAIGCVDEYVQRKAR